LRFAGEATIELSGYNHMVQCAHAGWCHDVYREEKQERKRSERRAARKALKEKKKLGLVADDRKKTLFELEQDRQRRSTCH
jgi:hypothetical protein